MHGKTDTIIRKADISYAGVLSEVGGITLIESHRESASPQDLQTYVRNKYNLETIHRELTDLKNIYHVLEQEGVVAGFSKIQFSSGHPRVAAQDVTKMDQIYLLEQYHGSGLGAKLFDFNIQLSRAAGQSGMWLVVWEENHKAIAFYQKFGFVVLEKSVFKVTDTHTNLCYDMYLDYGGKG